MKFGTLKYDNSDNVGDMIQSLAAEQFLPRVDDTFDRDTLRSASRKDAHLLILNGWFSDSPATCFPPSESIVPVFFGFHMTDWNDTAEHFLGPASIDYLKRHEPIGCRDRRTAELLSESGVKAFYSRCLTLTFPRREREPTSGKVFLVDVGGVPIPRRLRKGAAQVSHLLDRSSVDLEDQARKDLIARQLLDRYREEARLVITTRLHCAMPCVAMGIPVVFFGDPHDFRVSLLGDLGLKIHEPPRYLSKSRLYRPFRVARDQFFMRGVDWDPSPVPIEEVKAKMKMDLERMISGKLGADRG